MPRYLRDSVRMQISTRAATWIERIKKDPVTGLQVEPMGRMLVVANRDEDARRYFNTRLDIKGLPLGDKIFSLMAAVTAFADPIQPDRLLIAESYLRRLDAI